MAISIRQRLRSFTSFRYHTGRLLEMLATRQPVIYLALVTLFALLGYLLLLLFPLIALVILLGLPEKFAAINHWQQAMWLAVEILFMLLAIALAIPLFFNRFTPPRGMDINQQNAPKLWEQVEQLRKEFGNPAVNAIILREGFGIEGVRTPRFGLPLLYHNSLVIGLETLLTLSPQQVKSLLARRVGQLSGIHRRYINWLSTLYQIWPQYARALKQQKGPLSWPLRGLFALYSTVYSALALNIARQNELEADRYALDVADDEQLALLFTQLIITSNFLNRKFWPKIHQLAKRAGSGQPTHLPYTSLTQVMRRGWDWDETLAWIDNALETDSHFGQPTPPLRQRLENIGHHKPSTPRPLEETAANHFIDATVMKKIIDKFDQRWLARFRTA